MLLFGIIRHSPDELVRALLTKFKKPYYYYNAYGTNLPVDGVDEKFVLIPSIADFRRFYSLLNTPPYADKFVFVFASEVLLIEYSGLVLLDGEVTSDYDIVPLDDLKVHLIPANPKSTLKISRKPNKYVDSLIEFTHSQSIFNDLMTFIYKLPAKTHQKPVKVLCCACLFYDYSESTFRSKIADLRASIYISDTTEDTLVSLLNVEAAGRLRQAFKDNPTIKPADVSEVADNYSIHAFEISYILNVLSNEKDYALNKKKSIDDRMIKR